MALNSVPGDEVVLIRRQEISQVLSCVGSSRPSSSVHFTYSLFHLNLFSKHLNWLNETETKYLKWMNEPFELDSHVCSNSVRHLKDSILYVSMYGQLLYHCLNTSEKHCHKCHDTDIHRHTTVISRFLHWQKNKVMATSLFIAPQSKQNW